MLNARMMIDERFKLSAPKGLQPIFKDRRRRQNISCISAQWASLRDTVGYGMDGWFLFYIALNWGLSDWDNCYPGRISGRNEKREKTLQGKHSIGVSSWCKRAFFSFAEKKICSCRTSCSANQFDNTWLNFLLTSTFTPSKSSSIFIDLFIVFWYL